MRCCFKDCKINGKYIVVDRPEDCLLFSPTIMLCLNHAKWEVTARRKNSIFEPTIYKIETVKI
jgi:hypothetical protein